MFPTFPPHFIRTFKHGEELRLPGHVSLAPGFCSSRCSACTALFRGLLGARSALPRVHGDWRGVVLGVWESLQEGARPTPCARGQSPRRGVRCLRAPARPPLSGTGAPCLPAASVRPLDDRRPLGVWRSDTRHERGRTATFLVRNGAGTKGAKPLGRPKRGLPPRGAVFRCSQQMAPVTPAPCRGAGSGFNFRDLSLLAKIEHRLHVCCCY